MVAIQTHESDIKLIYNLVGGNAEHIYVCVNTVALQLPMKIQLKGGLGYRLSEAVKCERTHAY